MKTSKISKWGNSQGIRIPQDMLEESGLAIGDVLVCKAGKHKILLERAKTGKRRSKYKLADILAKVPENFQNTGYDWGREHGLESEF